ncbi:DUF4846 domain-containing protein [Cytophaga aurantiaca]|uniref:DUF4846 domain-containing protein n=1 Tax=Cytophaga aurantiaca TaxID=29530 RepID=UPI00037D3804|nr:DUF4846 domain-containing protein [Cytophaga aurantiaca]
MKLKLIVSTAILCGILVVGYCLAVTVNIRNHRFKEQHSDKLASTNSNILFKRFDCPEGYVRKEAPKSSFETWLRNVPLKDEGASVHLFNGELKVNQRVHAAVLTFDVGSEDLQQCADAVMRLRAEYLYQKKAYDSIVFTFTNGTKAYYSKWREGYRAQVSGNAVAWVKSAKPDTSHACFRKYMNTVFMYCGTYSLSKELKSISIEQIKGGDVFIHGGFPGHAMIVMDVAIHPATKKKVFMLAQSYMPAQEIHIVKNYSEKELSPWYEIPESGSLDTPEWSFELTDLKRF